MKKNDAIKQIEEMLPKCFGNDDKTFCTSTRESDEAKKFLLLLIKSSIPFSDFEKMVKTFLQSEHLPNDKIIEELNNITDLTNYLN